MSSIETYLKELLMGMDVDPDTKQDLYDEFYDHLTMSKLNYIEEGMSEKEAESRCIQEFGDQRMVGKQLQQSMFPKKHMFKKIVTAILTVYNLLLSLAAIYASSAMYTWGSLPPEWMGKVPFNNWASLAIFAFILFGLGNAIIFVFGFIKNKTILFSLTLIMGALFFLCTLAQILLVKEWYLATVESLFLSSIQILLGLFGLGIHKEHKPILN